MTATTAFVTEARQQFETQGYVVLRDFLEADVVRQAREAMQILVDRQAETLLAEGKITDPLRDAPFETRIAQLYAAFPDAAPTLYRPELHLPGLFPLFFHPRLLDVIETLLGPEIRLYPNYSARPKLPDNARTLVLWHQDGGYTGEEADALRMVNVWTALVPAHIENGCMEFVPGTHRLGLVPHEQREHYLEIAEDYLAPRRQEAVAIEAEPGDMILFHNLLFHRGLPNRAATVRWSLDWRYQDATQPTLRPQSGHIARSRSRPETAVPSAEAWGNLPFG